MHDFAEENAKRMAMGAAQGQILSGAAGVGTGPSMVNAPLANWPDIPGYAKQGRDPDPMQMSVASLVQGFHGLQKEIEYLKIEVSRHKLRVAELEHEKALRIG